MWTLIVAILGLGLLIVVHEAGHYVVARLTGMRVERFSIGFGPGIIKWRHKETLFQIAPIPFGGFVQIVGMNPHEEYDEKDPSVYPNRPAILRFLTIFAGPATNVISACVLIFFVFAIAGVPRESGRAVISKIVEGTPAAEVMKPGDVVTQVEGAPVTLESFRTSVMESGGRPLVVTVLREGQEVPLTITPRKNDSGVYQVGVNLSHEIRREDIGLGTAAVESVRYTYLKAEMILVGLWHVAKKPSDAEVMGPVRITDEINKQFRAGWVTGLEILALLNIYLGLFNLLPLPALDGSRLAFLVYEIATRRRPNPKVETAVHMAGTVVLLVVMVLVLFNDIKKVVG